MDPFAATLVTITVVTICAIFLFIFVCALQPKILRRLHGPSNGLDQDTESERSNSIEDRTRRKFRQENNDSKENNERDQIVYLKELEKSLRTGKRIENDDDNQSSEEGSQTKSTSRFMHFIRKHLRRPG